MDHGASKKISLQFQGIMKQMIQRCVEETTASKCLKYGRFLLIGLCIVTGLLYLFSDTIACDHVEQSESCLSSLRNKKILFDAKPSQTALQNNEKTGELYSAWKCEGRWFDCCTETAVLTQILLWIQTIIVLFLVIFPNYIRFWELVSDELNHGELHAWKISAGKMENSGIINYFPLNQGELAKDIEYQDVIKKIIVVMGSVFKRRLFMELLFLMSLVYLVFFLDVACNGEFFGLGINLITGKSNRFNPLPGVFPIPVLCNLTNSDITHHNESYAYCILPPNRISAYLYVVLWFFYFPIIGMFFGQIIWRIVDIILVGQWKKKVYDLYIVDDKEKEID